MNKSPESFGGNHETSREESRATGQKVRTAAEVAAQKEQEDRMRQIARAQAARRAAANGETPKNTAPSAAETLSPSAGEAAKKAKSNSAFKRALFGIMLGGGIALGAFAGYQAGKAPSQALTATEEAATDDDEMLGNPEIQEEANPFAGELPNGVYYDYNEYADVENKTSKNAYGYDKSSAFGNREATEDAWMDMANKGPEYLASYATHVFTDEEKQALGIAGMSCRQLDDYMSNAENIDGGEKQRNIMAALDAIARDQENTSYEFYYEQGEENTYYITFEDLNNDGNYSPDELKLGYATKKRNGAPQVDIYRIINGEKVKVLDLNMECGMQPDDEQPPEDLPPVPPEDDDSAGSETSGTEPTGTEPTGTEPTGSEPTGSEPTANNEGTTPPSITPKDASNMTRIDNQIQSDIANDIGSEQVTVHQTSAENQPVTSQPQSSNQTAPAVVQNEAAPAATPVQPSAPANVVSENKAPANEQVQNVAPNTAAQQQADAAKIEVVEPTDDELAAFGIN